MRRERRRVGLRRRLRDPAAARRHAQPENRVPGRRARGPLQAGRDPGEDEVEAAERRDRPRRRAERPEVGPEPRRRADSRQHARGRDRVPRHEAVAEERQRHAGGVHQVVGRQDARRAIPIERPPVERPVAVARFAAARGARRERLRPVADGEREAAEHEERRHERRPVELPLQRRGPKVVVDHDIEAQQAPQALVRTQVDALRRLHYGVVDEERALVDGRLQRRLRGGHRSYAGTPPSRWAAASWPSSRWAGHEPPQPSSMAGSIAILSEDQVPCTVPLLGCPSI